MSALLLDTVPFEQEFPLPKELVVLLTTNPDEGFPICLRHPAGDVNTFITAKGVDSLYSQLRILIEYAKADWVEKEIATGETLSLIDYVSRREAKAISKAGDLLLALD